jgi:hypothetical protein
MALDPITCWHVDGRSAVSGSIGEHGLLDVARHVADARPRRRRPGVKLALGRLGRAASPPVRKERRRVQRLSASASS